MIHVILYQPEIPQNTGNIMRTCASTGATLHVIGPIGFQLDDETVKRASMDYRIGLPYFYYDNLEAFQRRYPHITIHYVTRYGKKPHSNFLFDDVSEDYFIMFGKESTGIPKELLYSNEDTCMRIPMKPFARSLNLATCVAIVVYEVLRQQDYFGLATFEAIKGENYVEDVIQSKDSKLK